MRVKHKSLWTLDNFPFYDYFAEMQNRSLVSKREFTCLVDWLVDQSVDPSLLGS